MPALINPFVSFGSTPPVDLTDPWEEITRTSSVSGGKITIGGLNLTNIAALKVILAGITVTSDDSTVEFRLHVSGSEVSSGYQWVVGVVNSAAAGATASSTSDDAIVLTADGTATRLLGNASNEALGAEITVYSPGSTSLYKRCAITGSYSQAGGEVGRIHGAAELTNTGAITGITIQASSNITAGTVSVLGLE